MRHKKDCGNCSGGCRKYALYNKIEGVFVSNKRTLTITNNKKSASRMSVSDAVKTLGKLKTSAGWDIINVI